MTRSMRLIVLAMMPAVAWFAIATAGVAADLDTLMQEFRMSPSGFKPAPAFTVRSLEGKPAALTDHRGRGMLLYFWATW